MAAAVLAIFTAVVDILLSYDGSVHSSVIASAAVAAAVLAIITPFDASEPRERKRVVAACAVFVAGIAAALLIAFVSASELKPVGALFLLAAAGVVLLIWSFRTRNRRRLSGWSNYYDH